MVNVRNIETLRKSRLKVIAARTKAADRSRILDEYADKQARD